VTSNCSQETKIEFKISKKKTFYFSLMLMFSRGNFLTFSAGANQLIWLLISSKSAYLNFAVVNNLLREFYLYARRNLSGLDFMKVS